MAASWLELKPPMELLEHTLVITTMGRAQEDIAAMGWLSNLWYIWNCDCPNLIGIVLLLMNHLQVLNPQLNLSSLKMTNKCQKMPNYIDFTSSQAVSFAEWLVGIPGSWPFLPDFWPGCPCCSTRARASPSTPLGRRWRWCQHEQSGASSKNVLSLFHTSSRNFVNYLTQWSRWWFVSEWPGSIASAL